MQSSPLYVKTLPLNSGTCETPMQAKPLGLCSCRTVVLDAHSLLSSTRTRNVSQTANDTVRVLATALIFLIFSPGLAGEG